MKIMKTRLKVFIYNFLIFSVETQRSWRKTNDTYCIIKW